MSKNTKLWQVLFEATRFLSVYCDSLYALACVAALVLYDSGMRLVGRERTLSSQSMRMCVTDSPSGC